MKLRLESPIRIEDTNTNEVVGSNRANRRERVEEKREREMEYRISLVPTRRVVFGICVEAVE